MYHLQKVINLRMEQNLGLRKYERLPGKHCSMRNRFIEIT